jgi:hypothetical protein
MIEILLIIIIYLLYQLVIGIKEMIKRFDETIKEENNL